MASVIENQYIAKRNKSSPCNYKSAGYNSGFMDQFKQKPYSRKTSSQKRGYSSKRNLPSGKGNPSIFGSLKEKRGFSFPVPSPMTLAVIAATIVISLIVLNWEGIRSYAPDDYIFKPGKDNSNGEISMKYAITGVPGITQIIEEVEESQTSDDIAHTDESSKLVDAFQWLQYRVQKGDSVSLIAQKFGISKDAVIASNEIRNARRLQEGAVLRIPNIDGIPHIIKNGDNLSKISTHYNVPLEVILDVNDISSDTIQTGEILFIPGARMDDMDLRLSLGDLFIYPVPKVMTSAYGWRKDPINGEQTFHSGIDLRANTGTPVKAAMDGVVSVTAVNRVYGNYIIISHSNGYKTLYAHLSVFSVKQGDKVIQGRKIAESGNTGLSTGPHLHFSIYDKNGKLVNPVDLLN
ncbi:MAG: M23 family metallopeptidase [Treponema sp.]|jgi:murein DD-endopeptidase MepM/ murein hydrolase activator NlpD|nr:M23 family metallopeptidase [Treponema sp.]